MPLRGVADLHPRQWLHHCSDTVRLPEGRPREDARLERCGLHGARLRRHRGHGSGHEWIVLEAPGGRIVRVEWIGPEHCRTGIIGQIRAFQVGCRVEGHHQSLDDRHTAGRPVRGEAAIEAVSIGVDLGLHGGTQLPARPAIEHRPDSHHQGDNQAGGR